MAVITSIFIAIPWLNPFSAGPSPSVIPWLTALVCTVASVASVAASSFSQRARVDGIGATAWLAAALLSALVGVLQYFGTAFLFAPWVNSSTLGEAYANLRQRNQFASLTNIGLAALVWSVQRRAFAVPAPAKGPAPYTCASHDARVAPAWVVSTATATAAAVLAIGNASSSSRTGLVQLVMLIALAAWWGGLRRREVRVPLAAGVLAYALASALLPLLAGLDPSSTGIMARLQDGGPACASRLTLWSNVLHLISLKPWLGWGWGELDFAHFTTLYAGPRFCEILDNAHNLPLHLAVELGIPVASLICGSGLWLVWRAKPWRESDATRQMA